MNGAMLQYGDLACAVILVSALPFVRSVRALPLAWRIATVLILTILCLAEVNGVSLAGYVRGAVGDPAVTTTLLLLARLYSWISGRPLLDGRDREILLSGIAVAGILLYPMALGLGRFDPFAMGYGSELPAAAVIVLAGFALGRGRGRVAWLLVLPVLACGLSLLESDNLWNYFLDPMIVIYSMAWGLRRAIAYWKTTRSGA